MKVFLLLLFLISCKSVKQLHWQQKGTDISYDTIHLQTYKDSTGKIDTVKYTKHVYYRAKSPKTLKGQWYIVAALVIGAAVVVLLRK